MELSNIIFESPAVVYSTINIIIITGTGMFIYSFRFSLPELEYFFTLFPVPVNRGPELQFFVSIPDKSEPEIEFYRISSQNLPDLIKS